MSYIAWLVVFVVFAALELVSLGLTCIWFAIGALAGCVAALLGMIYATTWSILPIIIGIQYSIGCDIITPVDTYRC